MAASDTQIQEGIQSPALSKLGHTLNRLLIPIGLLLIGSGLAAWYFFFRPASFCDTNSQSDVEVAQLQIHKLP